VINEVHDKNWIASAACTRDIDGLTAGHAYTMMDALKLTDQYGKQWDLLKMRNPWGSEGYSGPWNDKDPRWTDELK
jgi:hypothetical protein